MTALLATATTVLLASPVSWSHHWVWVAPALMVLTLEVLRAPSRRNVAVAVGIGAVFLIGPHHLLPAGDGRELAWALPQHLVGGAYVIIGVGFLIRLAQLRQDPARRDTPSGADLDHVPGAASDPAPRVGMLSPPDDTPNM